MSNVNCSLLFSTSFSPSPLLHFSTSPVVDDVVGGATGEAEAPHVGLPAAHDAGLPGSRRIRHAIASRRKEGKGKERENGKGHGGKGKRKRKKGKETVLKDF